MLIRTERLILREFAAEDWEAVLTYQQDSRYLRYYPWRRRTAEDALVFVSRFIEWQQDEPRYRFQLAVCLSSTDAVIGNVGLRKPDPDAQVAELGFEFAPDQWGRGYATEAALAMLELGFGEWKLHRISAHCVGDNVASARVLEKVGMTREGRLRQSEFFKGRWWDVILFAALGREWLQQQAERAHS